MMKLLIIRHGDPDYEHDSLTTRGWEEANLLRDRLLKEKITKVYCSPLGRAQATAKPFLDASGMDFEVCDWMREFPRGITEPLKELGLAEEDRRICPWDLQPQVFNALREPLSDPKDWLTLPMYTEDGAAAESERIRIELDCLLERNGLINEGFDYSIAPGFEREQLEQSCIALFCHMGLGSLLLAHLARMSPPLFWQMFRLTPTSVSLVTFTPCHGGRMQPKILSVGDTTHLAPIGLTYRW